MPRRGGCSPMPPARRSTCPGSKRADDHPIVRLVEAGSHPDMRWLERLAKEKTGNGSPATSASTQVRELGEFLGMTAALSPWRVAVIDSVDELDKVGRQRAPQDARGAAAEHACSSSSAMRPGGCCRPSARAAGGCDFGALDDDAMTSILEAQLAGAQRRRAPADHRHVVRLGGARARLRRARPRQARGCGARDPSPGRSDQCAPLRACAASSARKARPIAMPPSSSSRRR